MKEQGVFFYICLFSFLLLSMTGLRGEGVVKGEEVVIEAGKKVSFDYALTVDGKVIDSSKDKGPLEYVHGEAKIIPGLARQLEGLRVGESKVVTVPAQEAYGQVNPQAFKEVAKTSLPKEAKLQVGMPLRVGTPDGKNFVVKIAEVKKDTVILDFNHPLAGKTLKFEVKIVSIQ